MRRQAAFPGGLRRTSRLFRVTRFCVIALLGITLAAAIGGAVCPIGRLIG